LSNFCRLGASPGAPEGASSVCGLGGSQARFREMPLELTAATGIPVFFCEPYSPWQRGSNENMNGLARQFLPKGTDLSTVTPQKIAYIEAMLNDRPRKIPDFRTPCEVYTGIVQAKLADRQALTTKTVALQT
jgi:hypothetical protein